MPTTYAHFKLGENAKKDCSPRVKKAIEAYPELFSIGLHGPDILFYYKALQKHPVNHLGHVIHGRSGYDFFAKSREILEQGKNNENEYDEAQLSYILGVIGHFSLDVICHGYIGEEISRTGISHAEIEMEFDRRMMVDDGLNPVSHKVTGHLVASSENARVIKDFYEGITQEEMLTSLRSMRFFLDFLVAPYAIKRNIITGALKLAGKYESMGGLMISLIRNPKCNGSTEKLLELHKKASKLAVRLMDEYLDVLDNEGTFDHIYGYNFETKLPD
ncbi:MAG: zinc dependent phospholipase C family protein [Eubacteriales bacterium]